MEEADVEIDATIIAAASRQELEEDDDESVEIDAAIIAAASRQELEEDDDDESVEIDAAIIAAASRQELEEDDDDESVEIDATIIAAASRQDSDKDNENVPAMTTEDDANLGEGFNDLVEHMTYARRIARYLSKYRWYNPHVNVAKESVETVVNGQVEVLDVIPPSLDSAWTYYEHFSLPRHLLGGSSYSTTAGDSKRWSGFVKHDKNRDVLKRAKYGEGDKPTRLYDVFMTPESEFADFGVGLAIYFWTLRILALIMLVAGFINVPTMVYFASTDYSALGQSSVSSIGVVGSSICTDQVWRACPTCSRDDWSDFPTAYERFASVGSLNFILRNECRIRLSEGIVALVSLLFVCISIYIMGRVSRGREVHYDEKQQTTSDYSVEVENPPLDAKDPDEWKDFFSHFDDSHVTFCTVALDNENLVRALIQRRKLVRQIEYLLKPGVRFDKDNLDAMVEQCLPVPLWQKMFLFAYDAPTLLKKIRAMEGKIRELAAQEKNVSNVFITFQTEQAQRRCLTALSVPRVDVWRNRSSIPESHLFRGKHVLAVREPPEPSSVRWEDLDDSNSKKIIQILASTIVSLATVAAGAVLIALARRRSAVVSAIVISILNQVTPQVCRFINNKFESHSSDGSRQASLYIKMTFFRWTNTVIITTIILPFSDSLTDGKDFLVNSVYAIFFSELLISPICVLTDSWGHFQRHVLGPRAPDQKRMNLNFRGGYFQLAERFTNMTKILFMTVFYAPFYPNGFFFSAITLVVVYWMDKFCLFRIWGRSPKLGTQIAEFSRNYFFTLALASYAIMLSYNYAGWPVDNACESDVAVSDEYVGSYSAVDGNGVPVTITIEEGDVNYYFCLQDMFRFKNPVAFPALARFQPEGFEWMTSDQETVSNMLGWTCVAVLIVVAIIFINRILIRFLRNVFSSPYKPRGEATEYGFSEVERKLGYSISAYVPQVSLPAFQYPLLACDVSEIDDNLIGWEDDVNGFNVHNVIYDIPGLAESEDPLFSIVKEWRVDTKASESADTDKKQMDQEESEDEMEETERIAEQIPMEKEYSEVSLAA